MKYILISILIFLSVEVFSQQGAFIAPNNIALLGYDTSGNAVGKLGRIYVLKPTNVQAPLSMVNDSTIGLTTPLTVPFGGTGNTTFTAYSVITAGTTATGAFQNVSGLGSSGNVLTSAGAGALPTWAAPATSGTVTSIATTSPITGGTITSTGTIACATCVVASSPGAGIAHFAGSTQTVTSSAVSLTADVTGVLPLANGGTNSTDYTTATVTFTNKRWVARVGSTTSSATPTINTDNVDIYKLTAQTADITSFTTNLSGTPNDGDILEIQITGTAARALTFGASFVSSTVVIPTTTVTTATLSIIFQYFTTSSYGNNKWVCAKYF